MVLPVFVLLCGLGATALATYLINENLRIKNGQRFRDAINHVERTIQVRMEAYIGLLRGGAGLFAANQYVTREQFRNFYERLEIAKNYPGIQGFGYTVRVAPDRVEALEKTMHAQGLTNFQVRPGGGREEYHSIVFLEPLDERNQRAIGFDMFTEPTRRRAMEAARDHGAPYFSRKVRLVQEIEGRPEQRGFLVYLPIYMSGQIPPTAEERRAQLQGFIYCPFRGQDLFSAILSWRIPGLAFALWDGTEPKEDSLLYQSHPEFNPATAETTILHVPGASWTLGVSELPAFNTEPDGQMLWIVPVLGVLASLLLSYLAFLEGRARTLSERSADDLFNQREWLQVTLGSIGDAVISTDQFGRVQFMNRVAEMLTGWKAEEVLSKPLREFFAIRDEASGNELNNPADNVLASGQTVSFTQPTLLTDRSGRTHCIDDSAAPIRDWHGNVIGAVLVFREVSERRRYGRPSTPPHAVTRVLAESPSLPDAAEQVLRALCEHLSFHFGITWIFDHASSTGAATRFWHEPSQQFDRFERACLDFHPRPGEGLPGLVWQTRQPQWISDFTNKARFPGAGDARRLGLNTAFAFPIIAGEEVFGALELFSREASPPDEELLNVARGIGAQIGQFVQRKRAEQALAESEELYRAISETAADGIVVIDENSRILAVNSAVERIFDYSRDELLGGSLKRLMPPRMHAGHDRGLKRFIDTAQRHMPWTGVELPGLHRDGHEIPLEISFGVARRGQSYLFTGLMRDITKRKEAERQLRETEEPFALLVPSAEEYAIITMDREGMISTWNPGAEAIFNYADHEVLGRGIEIFYTDEDQEMPARQLARAEEEGQVIDERWQVRKGGSQFWASGSVVCLRSEDGAVRGFAMILRDITERKKAEEAIQELNQELEFRVQRRTAALQESKEQMEAFSYTVAHDLRAPLRAMQGFAHALVEDYGDKLDLEAVEYLRRIMSSAHRMDELIQDLLAYSQLSRSDLTFKPILVEEAVQSALQNVDDEIRRRGAEIRLSLHHLLVRAHPATLQNAISNLVVNALKFTRAGERPQVHIRAINQGASVQISVQDNGIGIAPEHHDRIFRVFERLHGPDAFPGTGIGLAIVKKGVERMGGKVGLASEPGQGSIFWIELPREDVQV